MYLLFLSSNQIFPFLYRLSKVNSVHGDFDLANDIMFTETVKVENRHDQSLTTQITVGYLERESIEKSLRKSDLIFDVISRVNAQTLKVKVSLKTGQRFLRWTLVSNFFFLSGSM